MRAAKMSGLGMALLAVMLNAASVAGATGEQSLACYAVPGTVKAGPAAELEAWQQRRLDIRAGRHEYELFQVVLEAGQPGQVAVSLRWQAPAFTGATCHWYREAWIPVTTPSDHKSRPGLYPDALIPLATSQTVYGPGQTLLLGELYVSPGCPAGQHRGEVRVAAGEQSFRIPLTLTVWRHRLPEKVSLETAFGLDYPSIFEQEGVGSGPDGQDVLLGYYALMAEHRLSPISVYPEPVYFPDATGRYRLDVSASHRLWQYCYDQLGFNTLRIPFDESMPVKAPLFSEDYNRESRDYLRTVTAYLRENGWLTRAYIYISTVDEPATSDDYAKSRKFYRLVKAADPGIRYRHGEQIQLQSENEGHYDILDVNLLTYQRHQARLQGSGKILGWYTAVGPKGDFPTYFIDRPNLEPRMLCLMNYYFSVPRLLYWNITWWRQVRDPYQEAMTYHAPPDLFANGDGSLLYPGQPLGLNRPVASLRLKMIRDGIEDYEYCRMLEACQGRAAAHAALRPLIQSLTQFTRDPHTYEAWRRRVGATLDRHAGSRQAGQP